MQREFDMEINYTFPPCFPAEVEVPAVFQETARESFRRIIFSPRYRPLLERFRYTYEYRSKIRHLEESGEIPGMEHKLVNAISSALSEYDFDTQEALHRNRSGRRKISQEFEIDLVAAADEIVMRSQIMVDFVDSLKYRGVDLRTVKATDLSRHLATAIENYCNQVDAGVYGIPW